MLGKQNAAPIDGDLDSSLMMHSSGLSSGVNSEGFLK
jgi:hypothetical protein